MADPQQSNRLWTPNAVGLLRFRPRTTTGTAPNGERAKITVDDSGTVTHYERDEGLDATVRPATVRLRVTGPGSDIPGRLAQFRRRLKGQR